MIMNRVWAMPNKWTFQIPPIADLLARYVGDGKGWIDPFAGMYSPAGFTNDLNPNMPAKLHMDAFDFVASLDGQYDGALFDPPYSLDQIKRSYENVGLKSKLGFTKNGAEDATGAFVKVRSQLANHIIQGGLAICFGWNSNGFGKGRGFSLEEVLLVCHGNGHNDTIVTVERKVQGSL